MFQIQSSLKDKHCSLGILIMTDINNPDHHESLDRLKQNLEKEIVEKYQTMSRKELKELYPLHAYVSYYKTFGYTYHVLPQVESIAHGKKIPRVIPTVEAMFMAEVKNMLLTAGHDLEQIRLPLELKTAGPDETYTGISGRPATAVPGDFLIRDSESILSSILKGPDQRTCITPRTRQALFTIYAPEGIRPDTILNHLDDIESYIHVFSPDAAASMKKVLEF